VLHVPKVVFECIRQGFARARKEAACQEYGYLGGASQTE